MGAIQNTVVAVGIQTIFLVLVVVMTIVFVTEEAVLKTVDVCYMCLSSRLEAVELVTHIWRGTKEALEECGFSRRGQCGEKWGMPLCPLSEGFLYVWIPSI